MTISVEERSNYCSNVHCPFCGKLIVDVERGEDVNPCEHTLFVAHDEGFEFCDSRTKENLGIQPDQDVDEYIQSSNESLDEITNKINIPNSRKIAVYVPAPSFFGTYYGFVE